MQKELEDVKTIEDSLARFSSEIHTKYLEDGLTSFVTKSVNQHSHVIYALYIVGKKDYNYRLLEVSMPIDSSGEFHVQCYQNYPMKKAMNEALEVPALLNTLWNDSRFLLVIQHMKTMNEIISDNS